MPVVPSNSQFVFFRGVQCAPWLKGLLCADLVDRRGSQLTQHGECRTAGSSVVTRGKSLAKVKKPVRGQSGLPLISFLRFFTNERRNLLGAK